MQQLRAQMDYIRIIDNIQEGGRCASPLGQPHEGAADIDRAKDLCRHLWGHRLHKHDSSGASFSLTMIRWIGMIRKLVRVSTWREIANIDTTSWLNTCITKLFESQGDRQEGSTKGGSQCNEIRGVNYRQMVSDVTHKDLVPVRWNDVSVGNEELPQSLQVRGGR